MKERLSALRMLKETRICLSLHCTDNNSKNNNNNNNNKNGPIFSDTNIIFILSRI